MPTLLDFPLFTDPGFLPESGEDLAAEFDTRFVATYAAVNAGTGALFQRDTDNSTSLLHADFGGHLINSGGGRVVVAAGTYVLPASEATVYVEIDEAGTRSHRLDGFTADGTRKPLAKYATDAASILSFADARVDFDFMAGGSDGAGSILTINQPAHGFSTAPRVLKKTGRSAYALAQANSLENCETVAGLLIEVVDADHFKLALPGAYADAGLDLADNTIYYLSAAAPGMLTTVAPTAPGTVQLAVLLSDAELGALIWCFAGTVNVAPALLASGEIRELAMSGDTTASSDDVKVRLLVLRAGDGLSADDVLTLPNEEFFLFVTNETGVAITVTRATSGVTDSLPPEPDATATRLYKWIP